MSTNPNNRNALRVAFGNAVVADGGSRKRAAAICVKYGASAGDHPWSRVPDSNFAACLQELEALAGSESNNRTPQARRRPTFAAMAQVESNEAPLPYARSIDAAAIYDKWNTPRAEDNDGGEEY